ncbi:MAG: SPFH domain-containing protein [Planctomycetota bacterium]|jgi:regulator of protease activity HflC (stomatin/prohibitin superfamily)
MAEPATPGDRRAQHVAAVGFILQAASFGTLLWGSVWSESHAIATVARFVLAGLPIWVVLYLVFNQLRRVRGEQFETAELKRAREAGSSTAIFELDDEELLLEQHRLRWMVRLLLPSVTVLVALVLLVGHFLFWGWSLDLDVVFAPGGLNRAQDPTVVMWFIVGVGFFCFLFARYAIALSRLSEWRLLRAGASYIAGNALACLGLAIALMATSTIDWAEPLLAIVVRVAMIVLGIELTINFLLDFYRPRAAGIAQRPSFDSRLLGLTSEPGGIAKSIADAVNYQFGFEVSSTWFYQLLHRWLFPIVVVTFMAVLALTSIVIVDADELAVVERFGRVITEPRTVLEPGIHVKLPYPIDIVRRAPVKRIEELVIGEATEDEHEHEGDAVVWTKAHEFVPELMLLVASPKSASPTQSDELPRDFSAGGESAPVSLLMVSVPIEYRVKDIKAFLYIYDDPVKLMEGVAYQYLSDYAASVDIDELIGPGREAFNRELKGLIQDRLDKLKVGIEIVFAGLRGAHPPPKDQVAKTFQEAISAQINMAATVNAAEGEARRILTTVAGTEVRARDLDEAIVQRDRLRATASVNATALVEAEQRVEDLLVGNRAKGISLPSGEAAAIISEARSTASRRISVAATKARGFSAEVAAYEAAPELYRQRKRLEMYAGLERIRKYFIVGDPANVIIEYESDVEGGMDQVLDEGLQRKE